LSEQEKRAKKIFSKPGNFLKYILFQKAHKSEVLTAFTPCKWLCFQDKVFMGFNR